MSSFEVEIEISRHGDEATSHVVVSVDSRLPNTYVPRDFLQSIGIEKQEERGFVRASGERVNLPIGWAWMKVAGREGPCLVVFDEPGKAARLGHVTLTELGLEADFEQQRLVQKTLYLLQMKVPSLVQNQLSCCNKVLVQ
jgi:hypothetical protein